MHVLVTGGTGFIGTRLIERLRKDGHAVRALAKDRIQESRLRELDIDLIPGDLNGDLDGTALLRGMEVVIHLAGVTHAARPDEYYRGNREATRRLVDLCLESRRPLERFVHVSSLAASGPSEDDRPRQEDDPCRPVSHYGRSKRLGELEALRLAPRVPVVVLRPCAVYGPHDRDFRRFFEMARVHLRAIPGDPSGRISLIHVDDLVEGICATAGRSGAPGEVFNLAARETPSKREVARLCADLLDSRCLEIRVPAPMLCALGAAAGMIGRLAGRCLPLDLQKARELASRSWTCSIEKAVDLLGFDPRIGLAEGMSSTLAWYKANGWI